MTGAVWLGDGYGFESVDETLLVDRDEVQSWTPDFVARYRFHTDERVRWRLLRRDRWHFDHDHPYGRAGSALAAAAELRARVARPATRSEG